MRGAPSMQSMGGKARTSILGFSFNARCPIHAKHGWESTNLNPRNQLSCGGPIHAKHGWESTNLNPRIQLSCGVPHPCEAWVGKHEPQSSESAFNAGCPIHAKHGWESTNLNPRNRLSMRGAPSMQSMG